MKNENTWDRKNEQTKRDCVTDQFLLSCLLILTYKFEWA